MTARHAAELLQMGWTMFGIGWAYADNLSNIALLPLFGDGIAYSHALGGCREPDGLLSPVHSAPRCESHRRAVVATIGGTM